MLKRQLFFAAVLGWLPLASIAAEGPIVQDKEACKRQEQRDLPGENLGAEEQEENERKESHAGRIGALREELVVKEASPNQANQR